MNDHSVSDDDLLAYAFGDPASRWIAAHIASCPSCAMRLARLEYVRTIVRADATLTPSTAVVARVMALGSGRVRHTPERLSVFASVKRVVASLRFDGRSALAMQGLRGSTDAYVLSYGVDAFDVDLEIAPTGEGDEDRWQVTGQVSAAEPTGTLALAFTEPGNSSPLVEVQSDDDGLFFAELTAGPYDLLIRISDSIVVVPGVEVG